MRAIQFYTSVLLLVLIGFFSFPNVGLSQTESHNFITYDTVYNGNYGIRWGIRISRPANMFTTGNPDTASRPAIITMPGQGEMGGDSTKLVVYGPHYWLNNGWDGGVVLGNGTHYPIVVTVTDYNNPWPTAESGADILSFILKTYHIKRNSVHLGGLSQGSFVWTSMMTYEQTAGAETGMSMVTSLTALEGFALGVSAPYSTWSRGINAYNVWATKYKGKFLGLEGIADYRNVGQGAVAMNAAVPGSAFFAYENIGGGAHCCWNSMYDPKATNWTSVGTLGPNIVTGATANAMGTYKTGESIFQWMLRQGDTTLINSSVTTVPPNMTPPTVSAGTSQTVTLPVANTNLAGMVTPASGTTISTYAWTQVSGPSAVISTPSAVSSNVTGLVAGTYVFQLAATSSSGVTATSTVTITVNPITGVPLPVPTPSSGFYVKKVIACEYRTWYIANDGNVYAFNAGSKNAVKFALGTGRTAVDGAGAFNEFRVLDDQGYIWSSKIDYTTNTVRYDTDTTGAPFNGNTFIEAYGNANVSIRTDGSVWYWGNDMYNLFYSGGSPITGAGVTMRPTQISPAGMQFKKVLLGGNKILGLTTTGQVVVWKPGNLTPVTMTVPRPATDIFISHLDVAGCIVPDPGEVSGLGYPYIWGTTTSMYGGATAYSQTTSVKALWNMTSPIKEISVNWNTIHYIDSLGRMFGSGFNSMGEVGNGQEFVNKYTYPGFPGYGWTFSDYENPSGVPQEVGAGVKWKHLYSNNWYAYYKYAQDENDSIYSWGRNKALVLGNGFFNTSEQYSYDAMDVLTPTMVHPLVAINQAYDLTKPTISAGPKLTTSASSVTLTGKATAVTLTKATATAANGIDKVGYTITGWKWTQVSGNAAAITSPGLATTTVTGLTPGTYVFQLVTTDNNTGTNMARDTVVVTAPGAGVPVANAGPSQSITLPTNSVTLTGSGSETGGTITGYKWNMVSGPSLASINSANLATTTVTGLAQGVYIFQLTVTDAAGVTGTATVQVTVNAAPVVPGTPSANAGSNQTITLPVSTVTLTGSGSETNGTIASYAWTQVSGPATATIGTAAQATTAVSGLAQGVYRFQLQVTDALGVKATASVQVTVNPAPIVPGTPVANAGANQTITLPVSSVTLTGSGSETNGTIASYAWTQVSGPSTATIGTAGQAVTTVSGLVQGVYRFQLQVTDALGVTATATVQVTVNPAPVVPGPPSANAGSDQTITLPTSSVTLTGSGSETNGTIASYAWTQVSGPATAAIGTAGQAVTTVSGLVQGQYQFQLKVTDALGITATDVVTVTVNAAPVVPGSPSANAGSDQTITLPASSATLTGSGSEANGTIVSYAWTQVSGPGTATIGTAGQAVTTVSGLVQGVYQFRLRVTDALSITASDIVTVTVNAAPVAPGAPSASAGSNQTITLPTSSVTLTGSGSETNGTIVSYAWTQVSGPSTAIISAAGQAITTVSGLVQGVYQFQLKATDAGGVTATATVQVTVNPAPVNQPPVANAGPDQTVAAGTVTLLDGSASYDPDGTIVKYQWIQLSGRGGVTITNSNSSKPTLYGLTQGVFVFQLTVTDNGAATASDQVTITVTDATPPPAVLKPVAMAGKDTILFYPAETTVTLDGSASYETGGSIATFSWKQVSGPSTAVFDNSLSALANVSQLSIGDYVFMLTVTDAAGASSTATVTVHVKSDLRNSGFKVGLYPNPVLVSQNLNVEVSTGNPGVITFTIYDIGGRIVKKIAASSQLSTFQQAIPITGMSRGVYVLMIESGGKVHPYRFVVD